MATHSSILAQRIPWGHKRWTHVYMLFWGLHWVFDATGRLSPVAVSGDPSPTVVCWLLPRSIGSRCEGFSSCTTEAPQLWCLGLGAPRHVDSSLVQITWTQSWEVDSSRTRDHRILSSWTTREVHSGVRIFQSSTPLPLYRPSRFLPPFFLLLSTSQNKCLIPALWLPSVPSSYLLCDNPFGFCPFICVQVASLALFHFSHSLQMLHPC